MIFITSNSAKFSQAQRRLSQADISLTQFYMDLPELQASSAEAIACEKALVASTYKRLDPLTSKDTKMVYNAHSIRDHKVVSFLFYHLTFWHYRNVICRTDGCSRSSMVNSFTG